MSEKSDKAKAEYARKKKLRQKKHMEMIIPDKDIDKTYIQFNEDGGLNHYRKDIGMPTSGKHPDAISRIHKYMKRKDF